MKGIMFRPELIKAIVEGRKTVTRRAIKPQPSEWATKITVFDTFYYEDTPAGRKRILKAPRYQVGEVVYIKEAWQVLDVDTRKLRQPIHNVKVEYKLDGFRTWTKMPATISYTIPDKWHSPLHLAEITARYHIRIKGVRAERLQLPLSPDELEREGGEAALPMLTLIDGKWVFRYEFEKVSQ